MPMMRLSRRIPTISSTPAWYRTRTARIIGSTAREAMRPASMQIKKWWPEENLVSVYHTLCGPDLFAFARDAMPGGTKYSSSDEHKLIIDRISTLALPGAVENKETLGKVSTAQVQLQFIGNKPIADSLSGSSFDFRDMKRRPMTVYLILPGRYLATCAKWFRLIVASAIDAFLHEGENDVPVLAIL